VAAAGPIQLSGFFPKINLGEPKINKNERNPCVGGGRGRKTLQQHRLLQYILYTVNDKTFMIDKGRQRGCARVLKVNGTNSQGTWCTGAECP